MTEIHEHPPEGFLQEGDFFVRKRDGWVETLNSRGERLPTSTSKPVSYRIDGNLLAYGERFLQFNVIDSSGKEIINEDYSQIAFDENCIYGYKNKTTYVHDREGKLLSTFENTRFERSRGPIVIIVEKTGTKWFSIYSYKNRTTKSHIFTNIDSRTEDIYYLKTHYGHFDRTIGMLTLNMNTGVYSTFLMFPLGEKIEQFFEKEDGFVIKTKESHNGVRQEKTYRYNSKFRQLGPCEVDVEEYYHQDGENLDFDAMGAPLKRLNDAFKEKAYLKALQKRRRGVEAVKIFSSPTNKTGFEITTKSTLNGVAVYTTSSIREVDCEDPIEKITEEMEIAEMDFRELSTEPEFNIKNLLLQLKSRIEFENSRSYSLRKLARDIQRIIRESDNEYQAYKSISEGKW